MTEQRRHLWFWVVGLGGGLTALWLVSGVLLPFAAAAVLAYLLDPLVDRLEQVGVGRTMGTTVTLFAFGVVLLLVVLLFVPVLQDQLSQLVESLPDYATRLRDWTWPFIQRLMRRLSPQDLERLRTAAGNYAGELVNWVGNVVSTILTQGMALFDILSLLFVTPIVAFYLLRDWDLMVGTIDTWLPRAHADVIREQAREVGQTLNGFIHGQALVCLILGLFYAIGLSLVGLNFALIVGLLAGFLSFIPYVGSFVGFVMSVGLAAFQYTDIWMVGLVAGIFVFGQAVEGNILQPKLVGDSVNLHPVWIIFALLAAGNLFGFLGVLIAVPAAAVIGVLVRFALSRYLESTYYQGKAAEAQAKEPG